MDMYGKKCPECGQEMHAITVATNPPVPGYKCMRCGKMLFGIDSKTSGELLKEQKSDDTLSPGKVSPSSPKDNISAVASNDTTVPTDSQDAGRSEAGINVPNDYQMPVDIVLLWKEHGRLMDELKGETVARQKADKKLSWMMAISFVLGAIVGLVAYSLGGGF
jgi:DNA-directed RNA polymerase subunit RPC12/RpoP